MLARPSPPAERPAVATLDEELWKRVGSLLVARGRMTQRALDAAVAERQRTFRPLDEILVDHGVARPVVASAVLVVQLGDELQEQLRGRAAPRASAGEAFPDVPGEAARAFALACLGVDVVVISLACLLAAVARSSSTVPLPPAGWMALFAALSLGLYWAWRLATFATKLRPWADALLLGGSTSLAGLGVLTIRSLAGKSGVAESLLPLWAFATVYGVAGRMAFYLAWPSRRVTSPEPIEEPLRREPDEPERGPAKRILEVVPIRPELWGLLEELGREVDEVVRERSERIAREVAEAG